LIFWNRLFNIETGGFVAAFPPDVWKGFAFPGSYFNRHRSEAAPRRCGQMPALEMNRRLVILGFMGCGKTTVAREIARQLDCRFIDLDSFITDRYGRSPAEMIQQDGEPSFREIETLALRDALQRNEARVMALGGGTWTTPANRTMIALHDGLSVWLDAPFELCWKRIKAEQTVRPLAPDHETARTRYEARRADYALAEHRIIVSHADDQETIANQIVTLC
jgi:shikimate kinase